MQLLKLTIVELLLLPWQIVQTETMLVSLLGALGNHSFSQALSLLQSVTYSDCFGSRQPNTDQFQRFMNDTITILRHLLNIGYGHQSPLSTSGKVFCMVYALIGIPLTMLLLTAVVERLLIPTTLLLKWMNTKLGHMHTPFFIRVLHLIIVSSSSH